MKTWEKMMKKLNITEISANKQKTYLTGKLLQLSTSR